MDVERRLKRIAEQLRLSQPEEPPEVVILWDDGEPLPPPRPGVQRIHLRWPDDEGLYRTNPVVIPTRDGGAVIIPDNGRDPR